jgi:N-methylhydantoinase A
MTLTSTSAGRLGIDIGGTFTDGVFIDEESGQVYIEKVPTTPQDPSTGFLNTLEMFVDAGALDLRRLRSVIHGTTVATNALLERRGARVGLVVTAGFRDILEIGRQVRYELYNLQTEKPPPLIPRERCVEVLERVDFAGNVLTPLDRSSVRAAVEVLVEQEVAGIAICLLHAYRSPRHENEVKRLIQEMAPGILVFASHEVVPEIREYWRASTTVTNCYIAPVISGYLSRIERELHERGVPAPLHIVQSSGGLMTSETARRRPVHMLESGPASGVAAATFFASLAGYADAISFDMGGTTAKAGLIRGGAPAVLLEYEAGGSTGTGAGVAKGSGYPILGPVMDLVEVSAGGGSLAWIDAGGLLRVGPRSAGADPGPACYGKGGTAPTVTDANLVLGHLNPEYFLGGRMALDVAAARAAISEHCAVPLGLDVVQAASGILEIADSAMIESMRLVSIQRGYDPRDFALVAFGGAGPMHANRLADELGIPVVLVPLSPGTASALGMLVTDVRHDYRVTQRQPLAEADASAVEKVLADFTSQATERLLAEGFSHKAIITRPYVDLRYVGQSWKLSIPVPALPLTEDVLLTLRLSFDKEHESLYGYSAANEPVEIVNVGLTAVGLIPKPQLQAVPAGSVSPAEASVGRRPTFLQNGDPITAPVYRRYRLKRGNIITGPAMIEEMDATTVVLPDYIAEVVDHGTLVIHRA